MAFKKILIDTNICIDAALFRKPYVSDALKIIERCQFGELKGFIAAHSFDTIFYLLRKTHSKTDRYVLLEELRSVFRVAPVTQKEIDEALNLKWPDFEDAIHYRAAVAASCEAIVTRNSIDFKQSDLPVLTPAELLAQSS